MLLNKNSKPNREVKQCNDEQVIYGYIHLNFVIYPQNTHIFKLYTIIIKRKRIKMHYKYVSNALQTVASFTFI